MNNLQLLPIDILITIFALLSIPDILNLRQTSKQFYTLSKQPIVWINAKQTEILNRSWPCEFGNKDEEKMTRNAWRLGRRWTSVSKSDKEMGMPVRTERKWITNTSTAISDVRFMVVRGRRMLLTVSKGIWSVLTLWNIDGDGGETRKLSEWSPRGGLFTGLAINEDENEGGMLAVSVAKDPIHETVLLTVDSNFNLKPTRRIPSPQGASPLRAISFSGSALALADDISRATIFDWKTREMAILTENVDEGTEGGIGAGSWKHNSPIQIIFAHHSILVVRARSLSLFEQPILSRCPSPWDVGASTTGHSEGEQTEESENLQEGENEDQEHLSSSIHPRITSPIPSCSPIATHSFGWVDGIDVVFAPRSPKLSTSRPDLQIYVRAESDNPWRSDEGSIDVYTLPANADFDIQERQKGSFSPPGPTVSLPDTTTTPDAFPPSSPPPPSTASPYIFPPYLIASLSTPRGSLRCASVHAGSCGTALWICPRPPFEFAALDHTTTATNPTGGLVVDQWAVDGAAGLGVHTGGNNEVNSPFNGHGDTGLVDGNGIDLGVDIYGIGIGVNHAQPNLLATSTTAAAIPKGEALVAGVFSGPFLPVGVELGEFLVIQEPKMKVILGAMGSSGCTAMDYDEVTGRVVLGFGDGSIWVGEI